MFRNFYFAHKAWFPLALLLLAFMPCLYAKDTPKPDAPKPGEPTDPKARKTFAAAIDWENHRDYRAALDDFRKANKQDGGHCWECLNRAYALAFKVGAYKDAVE